MVVVVAVMDLRDMISVMMISVGNNAASRQQRLSDPLFQSYKRTLLEYIHSQENP